MLRKPTCRATAGSVEVRIAGGKGGFGISATPSTTSLSQCGRKFAAITIRFPGVAFAILLLGDRSGGKLLPALRAARLRSHGCAAVRMKLVLPGLSSERAESFTVPKLCRIDSVAAELRLLWNRCGRYAGTSPSPYNQNYLPLIFLASLRRNPDSTFEEYIGPLGSTPLPR